MFDRAREILDGEVAQGVCHGYAMAVGQGGTLLGTVVGGTLGGKGTAAVSAQTRYDVASLTGMMVTMPLTLLAVEQGQLTLSDRLSLYFDVPADKKDITLVQLLTHTSGMEGDFLLEQSAETAKDALHAILHRPLASPVGKHARYSAIGVIALGYVLEKVYGMALDRAARQHVFTPLGLKSTGFLPVGEHIAYTAASADTGEPRIGTPNDVNTLFLHGVSGNGGLFASAEDCARYMGMLACGGRAEGVPFLSGKSIAQAATNHTKGMERGHGFLMQIATERDTFMGDLWPVRGSGHVSPMGCSLALDAGTGLHVSLLMNRVRSAREHDLMLRVRRLVHSSVMAEALKSMDGGEE